MKTPILAALSVVAVVALLIGGCSCVQTIPAGHVGVPTLFGNVVEQSYDEGLHFPTNPLYSWTEYDCREKTVKIDGVQVPTKDQQSSRIDFSIQYRLNKAAMVQARGELGTAEDIINVRVTPNIRSLVRSEGKAVVRCEELYDETVQSKMQTDLQARLQEKVGDYVLVTAVLIRDIQLPTHIQDAIRNKKVREQKAEEQKAELARFRTEQEQKVAQAAAEREAAEEEAKKKMVLADADAYEITKVNEALANSPAFIRLEAVKTLEAISKNPATQIYFLNGDSPDPLPLMHLGEVGK